MDYHLIQSVERVRHTGLELSNLNQLSNDGVLAYVEQLEKFIEETKTMLSTAIEGLETGGVSCDVDHLNNLAKHFDEDSDELSLIKQELAEAEGDENEEHRMGCFESGVTTWGK